MKLYLRTFIRNIYRNLKTNFEFSENENASLAFLEKGLGDRPIKSDPNIITRVGTAYLKAKQTNYSITGMWEPIISEDMGIIDKSSNISQALENFFRNGCSNGLVTHDTFKNLSKANKISKKDLIITMLNDIKLWRELVEGAEVSQLKTPAIGNPWGYFLNNILVIPDSARHHYYSYRVKNILSNFKNPVIAEIGGGYGGFAYHLLKDSNFHYINFDIPEIVLISSYYLLSAFPEKKFLLFGEADGGFDFEKYDVILMPHFEASKLKNDSIDLFINSNSLAEMSEKTVIDYIANICRSTKKYFYHINSDEPNSLEFAASKFPITSNFKQVHKYHCGFGGFGNRYREYLYERVG